MSDEHIEHWTGDRMVKEIRRLRMENAELLAFVKAYRDTEHPSYLWSLSTALLEKHAPPGKEER